ncbi:hypothetical protein [Streptomyces sp. NPDC057909]|uniref:hypothetical protein n=1 Tax=Streptomyces sp. NPDC057909 TaxID=3346277 RepID=UPI0036E61085
MSFQRSIARRVGAAAAAVCSLSGLALGASASPASALDTVKAGFAVVGGNEPIGSFVDMSSTAAYNSAGVGPAGAPASVYHVKTGYYEVRFPGLATPKAQTEAVGVHARANGDANCMVEYDLTTYSSYVGIPVTCFDSNGQYVDTPFTVTYTSGGSDTSGNVVSALTNHDFATASGQQTALRQQSSVGGSVTYNRSGTGAYSFDLPYLSNPGAETFTATAVTPGSPYGPQLRDVTCGISNKTTVNTSTGPTRRVFVSCTDAVTGQPTDSRVSLTYARGSNVLGRNFSLGEAYLATPKMTNIGWTTLTDTQAHDKIYGVPGTVTVQRMAPGTYTVDLPHQGWGSSQPSIMATPDGSTANCSVVGSYITKSDTQHVTVLCRNAGTYTDTGFNLQFLTKSN